MFTRNMGRLDRTVRFIVGVALAPIGLFGLSGLQGRPIGLVVVGLTVMALVTSLTGVCPAYVPLGISTLRTSHDGARHKGKAAA